MSTQYIVIGMVVNGVMLGVAAWQCRRLHDLNASMNDKHEKLNEIFAMSKKYVDSVNAEQEYMQKDLDRFEKRLNKVEGK